MIEFEEGNPSFCLLKLGSHADQRRVLRLFEKGVVPRLHHRDNLMPEWELRLSETNPQQTSLESAMESATLSERFQSAEEGMPEKYSGAQVPLLHLSGLPGVNNREWGGVRMTEAVISSMVHRAFGIQTSPEMVVFGAGRTECWLLLPQKDISRVHSLFRSGVKPVLHHKNNELMTSLSNGLQIEVSSPRATPPLPAALSTKLEIKSAEESEHLNLVLTGLPGMHPAWRFVNESVIASIMHRTFSVKTSASGIFIEPNRKACEVMLSESDARYVVASGRPIVLHHRDPGISSLVMKPTLQERVPVEASSSWQLIDNQTEADTSAEPILLHPSWRDIDTPEVIGELEVGQVAAGAFDLKISCSAHDDFFETA
eukprot:CAMPEP_0172599440 /NCGR_PEP_ID=MMETSP1068-20121228/19528_1 /TAXON_ID=35684 /ORGANISM="Pseudopedinella elastica, Strain CCMP716" /LENGTH=370 /DNA_ID=CAMNT_0013399691 /DNA_START=521 /DNA_END=1633 /DNA_ORIENTATION=-